MNEIEISFKYFFTEPKFGGRGQTAVNQITQLPFSIRNGQIYLKFYKFTILSTVHSTIGYSFITILMALVVFVCHCFYIKTVLSDVCRCCTLQDTRTGKES